MKNTFVCIIILLLITSCAGLIQKSGEFLEGNGFNEKTTAIFISYDKPDVELREVIYKDDTTGIIITSNKYPHIKIHGDLPANNGSLTITRIDFFTSHIHGWNEFTLELSGQGYFVENRIKGSLTFDKIDALEISSGRIRYKENRITGAEALTSLQNRRERILALVEWMETPEVAQGEKIQFASEKEFERHWKNILFPELAFKNNRPPEYSESDTVERANDVNWNVNYTKAVFPEELWEIRNSGALLRDWEEALSWIYFEYARDEIIAYFNGLEFHRTK